MPGESPSVSKCPYCHEQVGTPVTTCPTCAARYHPECLKELGRCGTLGCRWTPTPACRRCGKVLDWGDRLLSCNGCAAVYHRGCLMAAGRCVEGGCEGQRAEAYHLPSEAEAVELPSGCSPSASTIGNCLAMVCLATAIVIIIQPVFDELLRDPPYSPEAVVRGFLAAGLTAITFYLGVAWGIGLTEDS